MTDTPQEPLDDRVNVQLAMSNDGNGTIYILPENDADSRVAVPVRDKDMGWHKANPETYQAMIDRFNAAPDQAAEIARLRNALAELLQVQDGVPMMGQEASRRAEAARAALQVKS